MKKVKRISALSLALMMAVAIFAMPASAYAKTETLDKNTPNKYISIAGNYTTAAGKLKVYSDSNDGVYLHIEYRENGGYWTRTYSLFGEPGQTASVSNVRHTPACAWWGILTSWWPGGTGCHADGTLTLS